MMTNEKAIGFFTQWIERYQTLSQSRTALTPTQHVQHQRLCDVPQPLAMHGDPVTKWITWAQWKVLQQRTCASIVRVAHNLVQKRTIDSSVRLWMTRIFRSENK